MNGLIRSDIDKIVVFDAKIPSAEKKISNQFFVKKVEVHINMPNLNMTKNRSFKIGFYNCVFREGIEFINAWDKSNTKQVKFNLIFEFERTWINMIKGNPSYENPKLQFIIIQAHLTKIKSLHLVRAYLRSLIINDSIVTSLNIYNGNIDYFNTSNVLGDIKSGGVFDMQYEGFFNYR